MPKLFRVPERTDFDWYTVAFMAVWAILTAYYFEIDQSGIMASPASLLCLFLLLLACVDLLSILVMGIVTSNFNRSFTAITAVLTFIMVCAVTIMVSVEIHVCSVRSALLQEVADNAKGGQPDKRVELKLTENWSDGSDLIYDPSDDEGKKPRSQAEAEARREEAGGLLIIVEPLGNHLYRESWNAN